LDLYASRVPGAPALKKAELSILLTDDKRIQRLNRDWRNLDKPTDVLSFPLVELEDLRGLGRAARRQGGRIPAWWLGDIVISMDRAAAQAKENEQTFREELELLLVHGILHLLHFDHEKSAPEAVKMRAMEQKLLGRTMIYF
jgi:probable rRNA maturation factor